MRSSVAAALLSVSDAPQAEARWMLQHAQSDPQLRRMVWSRTRRRKPLQYVLGDVPFAGMMLRVDSPMLIPRPETEEWVLWVSEQLQGRSLRLLDLGCGSGCIALALARHLPESKVLGIDSNPRAIELAQSNALLNNVRNVEFRLSDFSNYALIREFAPEVALSNPPYVSLHEWNHLAPELKWWEDPGALVSPDSGLSDLQNLISSCASIFRLATCSHVPFQIVLEFGSPWQSVRIKNTLHRNGFQDIQLSKDLFGNPRWITAKLE